MRSDRFDEEDDFGSDSDDDEVKPKPKKPTVELDICCPACQACIHVKAYKQRVSEPVKPEYRVTADVELGTQMTLPGMAEKKPAAAQVEEPVKPEYRVTAGVELGTQMTLPGMAEKWFKPFSSREWHAIHKPRPDGIELSVCCTWRAVDDAPREERELGAAGNCPACVRILKGREGGAER